MNEIVDEFYPKDKLDRLSFIVIHCPNVAREH